MSIIQVEIIIPSTSNVTTELIPDYTKVNFNQMREILSEIDWEEKLGEMNTEESWNSFKDMVLSTVDGCIPKKKWRSNNKPLWMQRNVMRIIRTKRRLWKHYSTTKNSKKLIDLCFPHYVANMLRVAPLCDEVYPNVERERANGMFVYIEGTNRIGFLQCLRIINFPENILE